MLGYSRSIALIDRLSSSRISLHFKESSFLVSCCKSVTDERSCNRSGAVAQYLCYCNIPSLFVSVYVRCVTSRTANIGVPAFPIVNTFTLVSVTRDNPLDCARFSSSECMFPIFEQQIALKLFFDVCVITQSTRKPCKVHPLL